MIEGGWAPLNLKNILLQNMDHKYGIAKAQLLRKEDGA
jgi:hypothetical protein